MLYLKNFIGLFVRKFLNFCLIKFYKLFKNTHLNLFYVIVFYNFINICLIKLSLLSEQYL